MSGVDDRKWSTTCLLGVGAIDDRIVYPFAPPTLKIIGTKPLKSYITIYIYIYYLVFLCHCKLSEFVGKQHAPGIED